MASLVIGIEQATDFLVDLLNIHSPTGYTADAIDFIEEQFNALDLPPGSSTERTRKGALLVHIPGESSERPVGLTAHADTLGLMVTEIKSNGRLKFTGLGGVMWSGVEFEGVTVRTSAGDRIRGTVVPVNGSVHVNKGLRDMKRNPDTLEVRLDVRTSSADETRKHGIDVGDFIFLDPRVELTDTGFIRSRFLDDKLSVACIYAAVAALNGDAPAQDTTILISNYEEVGHGGSADWPADLFELIAVDMAAVGEGQNSDEFHCTLCIKDSGGPYSHESNTRLRRIAAEQDITLKTDIYPYYSSDATAYWRAGGAARAALIGPGVDSSHSYERTHTDALRDSARLIAAYLQDDQAGV